MKLLKLLNLLVSIFLFSSQIVSAAEDVAFVTGKEWLEKMSVREKLLSLIPPTLLMHRYGVSMRYPAEGYIETMDKVLEQNPEISQEDVSNIYVSTLYTYEPESRDALDNMEREFQLRKAGHNPEFFPRLLIRQDSRKEL